jgi:hypothetical protein
MDHGVVPRELLEFAGCQELEVKLDGVPEGWGDMLGYLDVVAENSTFAAEMDC